MKSYIKLSLIITCVACVIFCNTLCEAKSIASLKPPVPETGKEIPTTTQSPSTTFRIETTTVQEESTSVDFQPEKALRETTSESPVIQDSSADAPQDSTPGHPTGPPPNSLTQKSTSSPAKPPKGSLQELPADKPEGTKPGVVGLTSQRPNQPSPTAHITNLPTEKSPDKPVKKGENPQTTESPRVTPPVQLTQTPQPGLPVVTTARKTTREPTTQAPTTQPRSLTTKPQSPTTQPQSPTTQPQSPTTKPKPVGTEPRQPATTRTLTTKSEPQAEPTANARTPAIEGHQPPKTEGSQPEDTGEDHDDDDDHHDHHSTTIKPGSDTNKNNTSWFNDISHNTVVTKLMLPIILGIVAAIVIVCFAYGIRACKKNTGRSGRRKMMQNGMDHDMGGNMDRMKLLADSSEDEF